MKKIAIYGAGGFGREVALLIEQINQHNNTWEIAGFFDDGQIGKEIYGYPVLGDIHTLNSYPEGLHIVCAIADPQVRKRVISQVDNPFILYPVLIHPSAYIGHKDVTIGEGSIITAGTIITVNIDIGRHVIINLSTTIGHDTQIGDYCSLMPAVNISGEVTLAEGVFVGTGASILNQLSIGEHTTVGAGAVVTKDLPGNCTAVGVPARVVK